MTNVKFNTKSILTLSHEDLQLLKDNAEISPAKRARLCLHHSHEDPLHDMIIAIDEKAYIRPHKHVNKTESFHLIEGNLFFFIFDNNGEIKRKIALNKNANFIVRLEKNIWHSIVPSSKKVIIHELTNGPYIGSKDSIFASWSPDEKDAGEIRKFKNKLLDHK